MLFKKTELAKSLEERKPELNFTPRKATAGSNGYDLFACLKKPILVSPGEIALIGTGIHIDLEGKSVTGLLLPRSSTTGLRLTNTIGLIDSDYQGEIMCKYQNTTEEDEILIFPGMKLAQLVIVLCSSTDAIEVEEFTTTTERGENGFGSTGAT